VDWRSAGLGCTGVFTPHCQATHVPPKECQCASGSFARIPRLPGHCPKRGSGYRYSGQ
jgi:hypothetical protein